MYIGDIRDLAYMETQSYWRPSLYGDPVLWGLYYGDLISIIETTLWRLNFGDLIL